MFLTAGVANDNWVLRLLQIYVDKLCISFTFIDIALDLGVGAEKCVIKTFLDD